MEAQAIGNFKQIYRYSEISKWKRFPTDEKYFSAYTMLGVRKQIAKVSDGSHNDNMSYTETVLYMS